MTAPNKAKEIYFVEEVFEPGRVSQMAKADTESSVASDSLIGTLERNCQRALQTRATAEKKGVNRGKNCWRLHIHQIRNIVKRAQAIEIILATISASIRPPTLNIPISRGYKGGYHISGSPWGLV